MITLVEIKHRRIFFVTNEKQLLIFLNALIKNECCNSVVILDNDFLAHAKVKRSSVILFDRAISYAHHSNISFVNICEDKHFISAKYKIQMERLLEFDNTTIKHKVFYSDLRTGNKMLFEGDL